MADDSISPLLTPEGWDLLASIGPYSEKDSLALAEKLRKAGHSAELTSAVLTQSRLRTKATAKFGEFAQQMLFTQTGLEQATRLQVAVLHAQRFAQAGVKSIADLGCGLGADSLAFSTLDLKVTAVEQDEITAACATINLMPFPDAKVLQAEASTVALDDVDGVWLDPARRATSSSGSTRIFDPEAFSPPLSFVEQLANRGLQVGVKLGPGIPHESIPGGCEAQWVSVAGELVEVTLWFNSLARPGIRRAALLLGPDGAAELSSPVDYLPAEQQAAIGPLEGYLYEPDSAVIRAGLVADLANHLGAHLIDPQIAYLCSPELIETPFARAYRVLEVLPYNVKGLRSWVRENNIGSLEIKKRGTAVTPEELRKQLLGSSPKKARGSTTATLVLTRIGQDRVAAVVEAVSG
ncbi:SAM-dependent methyltransferase [Psychromicrobium sp. YIM B11713]|uniref:THUMP-like domain-containing protein n=1 Tax=Psychromicrobium sp. YIM B11713 TaxID=3145233 RepID=UPI00374EDF0E